HRAGRRSNHADDPGQKRQELLARLVEQSLGGKLLLALLEELHQRANAGRLQPVADDLIAGTTWIGRQPASDDDLKPLLGVDAHAAIAAFPDDGVEAGALVLQRKVRVAGGLLALEAGNLAADPYVAVGILDGAFERRRKLRDGPFHNVIEGSLCHQRRISCGRKAPCYTKPQPVPKGRLPVS